LIGRCWHRPINSIYTTDNHNNSPRYSNRERRYSPKVKSFQPKIKPMMRRKFIFINIICLNYFESTNNDYNYDGSYYYSDSYSDDEKSKPRDVKTALNNPPVNNDISKKPALAIP
jgi:hypothetical protein